ncbi:MAG TPA: NAD-dependent epimerase/dehydratase family protein [Solirubrobacterales bacterium]|nr:NAD-dependent epimerase/dehydratase family protein [Solirubrobacterales bacterium]
MRVAVVGASGNVGTSVVAALAADPQVDEIVGLARRLPELELPKLRWAQADVVDGDLQPHFRGADAVVHLAWAIQPQHDRQLLERTNVQGSERVFAAAAAAGARSIVYASSVGAYAVGPKDRTVDESWSTAGIESSIYSRQKADVERLLDRFEAAHPQLRVVRLRPGLIFKAEAASEIRRLFLGPLFPRFLANPRLIPVVPRTPRLRFQAVHSYDVGEAYRLAVVGEARGAFNIAAEPVIGPPELAQLLGARQVPVPPRVLRTAAHLGWRAHLQPAGPGWVDMALGVPLMDTARARTELGWEPRSSSLEALADLLRGLREGRGAPTPPLDPETGGPARLGELATGVGQRQ